MHQKTNWSLSIPAPNYPCRETVPYFACSSSSASVEKPWCRYGLGSVLTTITRQYEYCMAETELMEQHHVSALRGWLISREPISCRPTKAGSLSHAGQPGELRDHATTRHTCVQQLGKAWRRGRLCCVPISGAGPPRRYSGRYLSCCGRRGGGLRMKARPSLMKRN
ncbi:hypothetical protein BT67DRAFT_184190 [Trichocladium antarcticum]|uniref:Uncharacterized protein n=1 Tax=Trichocladium antarcticum TaxID=1450529 RepID=A0AAN6UPI5_9PEZI|nr:hypothetical protein BT67DRAFT_184190 [Trichocladium antarcticum]